MGQSWISRTVHNPEANFLLFSFLFNFVWEMWQMPFYEGLKTLDYMLVVRTCTQASLGDGVISVLAYWSAVLIARSRNWIHEISITPMIAYLTTGLVITIFMEWLATNILDRWQYAPSLPVLPILGTGLLPVLQWSILPLLLLFVVHRQTLKKALM
tara:strand:+ start:4877 stop:5344 length:468 start_codon:yes stop_codon:yes gene_type:complete